MNQERKRPKPPSGDAKKAITPNTADSGAENSKKDHPSTRWGRKILAAAGAIVTIGGAITVISQYTHLLSGVTHASTRGGPSFTQVERSPILGISFYQNAQLDPMSIVDGSDNNPIVNVTMKSEPFELWFPTLATPATALEVCAAHARSIYNNISQTGKERRLHMPNPRNRRADYPYASGFLAIRVPPDGLVHTHMTETRVEAASGGDQKYYVSNLANEHGKIYLVVYRNDNRFNSNTFESNNVEYFILNFSK